MNKFGEVVVVAPDSPQSGKGHAITIESTISCDSVKIDDGPQIEYSCSGTPVDCVKLAMNKLLERKPDLCVSGINHGSNSSINVIYSGTMSAAVEGSLEGIPSIGFSLLDYSHKADFSESESFIKKITKSVLVNGLPDGVCLNVNIPKSEKGKKYKELKFVDKQMQIGKRNLMKEKILKAEHIIGLTGKFVNFDKGEDTDEWAL